MRTSRKVMWGTLAWIAMVAGADAYRKRSRGRQAVRWAGQRVAGEFRRWQGPVHGAAYRLTGHRPDPNVADDVLADRVRATLGPVERRLDLPRVHVMVEDHIALLHGDVGTDDDVRHLEDAVKAVSGVRAVQSFLHVGLLPGDSRPSEGHPVGK